MTSSTTCAADWRSTDRRQSALAVVLRSRTGHLKPAWGTGGSGSQGLCPRSFGKALFFGLQDPSASGVRHREGGSGSRASASAHGEISGRKLTCIHETQVLPAEDLVRPPVYELPGRKVAPFCEPPRAPRAFPTDHVSQKQFSGERGCAAGTPTARDTIISTRRREEVILDKLPSARDIIARTAAAHACTFLIDGKTVTPLLDPLLDRPRVLSLTLSS